jgi:hypothetical protein
MAVMLRVSLFAVLLVAQSFTGCLDSFRKAIPTGAEETALAAFEGSWTSIAASTAQQSCTDFTWTITDVSASGVSGEWGARCFGTVPVAGTATGTLDDGTIRWAATGTGSVEETGACAVALTGSAYRDNAQIRIPYSGTTCLGAVSGTEILRK